MRTTKKFVYKAGSVITENKERICNINDRT